MVCSLEPLAENTLGHLWRMPWQGPPRTARHPGGGGVLVAYYSWCARGGLGGRMACGLTPRGQTSSPAGDGACSRVLRWHVQSQANAHAGSRARVTSMGACMMPLHYMRLRCASWLFKHTKLLPFLGLRIHNGGSLNFQQRAWSARWSRWHIRLRGTSGVCHGREPPRTARRPGAGGVLVAY